MTEYIKAFRISQKKRAPYTQLETAQLCAYVILKNSVYLSYFLVCILWKTLSNKK